MWLDMDTAAAVAWQDEQNVKCPGCGKPTDETMADGAYYVAEAVTCASCRSRDLASKSASEDGDDTAGVHWAITSPLIRRR